MDKTVKKCVTWSVICFALATVLYMIWPLFLTSTTGDAPWEPNLFSGVVQPVLSISQNVLISIGGALVGAAVVIHWLTSRASVNKTPRTTPN